MFIIHNRLIILSMALAISSCNDTNPAEADQKGNNHSPQKADSNTQVAAGAGKSIQGPAGALYVDDGGSGGIPVVLVHSFGGSTAHWKAQLEHLRTNRRVIAFDLRGHGRSNAPAANDYAVASLADDIAAVVDSLHLDRFILVAHSMGGTWSTAYTSKHPDRVAGLLLAATPGKTPAEQAKPIIASLESDSFQKTMDNFIQQLLVDAQPTVQRKVLQGSNQIPRPAAIHIIKSIFQYDPLPALKRYKGPLLIVSTTREEQPPNTLHKQLPNIPYKAVDGASHWIQLDKPDEFNTILDEFLSGVEKEEGSKK
jgi:pimeloyl-ACP methyl ester carboxylesterase